MVNFENGIVNLGDWGPIKACMEKARQGSAITVAFLGGSITQGSLSSTPETCYAYRVYQWWKDTFPQAYVRYVNAGIGGTTSQFGVARVKEDVLRYEPDFLLTEFCVNDDNTPHFQETYEGLIRTILSAAKVPALMLMHNVCYDTGCNAEDQHLPVAQHYGLPCVSMKHSIYPEVESGRIPNREITPDDLHPNDAGHALVAGVIIHLLEKIRASQVNPSAHAPLKAPITANAYQNSVRWQNHNCEPVLEGFQPDYTPQNHITETFRRGFTAWHKGDKITFTVDGTGIAVQYRKSVKQPTPIARITVDGEHAMLLDGNFKETWGDCTYIDTVCRHIASGVHKVEIEIVEASENDVVPFYLIAVIGSKED